jgi:hypothetical protein
MSSSPADTPVSPEEVKSSYRLITQNLLSSSAYFEGPGTLDWAAIQDLSTFIDIFCLYEKAVVLGRAAGDVINYDPSSFYSVLREMDFISIQNPTSEMTEPIANTAVKHLAAFLEEKDTDRFQDLVRAVFEPSTAFYSLTYKPDRGEEVQLGKEWLQTTPSSSDVLKQLEKEAYAARAATFLVRTFLYLAYADVSKITLTPDVTRTPVLQSILQKEENYRQEILSKFKGQWEKYPSKGEVELRRNVSPFAAIIFQRSKTKQDIPEQMAFLRHETEALRRKLLEVETKALWWATRDEAITAERKWNEVLQEIETNFGSDPRVVTIKRGLNLAESASEVGAKPYTPKSWIKLITNPVYDIVKRFVARGPAIEIHTLRSQLQSPKELRADIDRLFGKIQ